MNLHANVAGGKFSGQPDVNQRFGRLVLLRFRTVVWIIGDTAVRSPRLMSEVPYLLITRSKDNLLATNRALKQTGS